MGDNNLLKGTLVIFMLLFIVAGVYSVYSFKKYDDENVHAYYKYYTFVKQEALKKGWDRDRIIAEILSKGVPCMHGSCSEVYLEKAFDNTGLRPNERLPIAKKLGETSMVFLVHPTLNENEMHKIAEVATSVFSKAVG